MYRIPANFMLISNSVGREDFAKKRKMEELIYVAAIGLLAGVIASTIMKTGRSTLLKNFVLGILGSFLGNYIFGWLGLGGSADFLGSLVTATIGAIILIYGARFISR